MQSGSMPTEGQVRGPRPIVIWATPRSGFFCRHLGRLMPQIAFIGNVQLDILSLLYRSFSDGTHLVTFAKRNGDTPLSEVLVNTAEADVYVVQVLSPSSLSELTEALPGKVRSFFVPFVSTDFLWPFGGQPHPKNAYLPYRHGGHSLRIGRRVLKPVHRKGHSAPLKLCSVTLRKTLAELLTWIVFLINASSAKETVTRCQALGQPTLFCGHF